MNRFNEKENQQLSDINDRSLRKSGGGRFQRTVSRHNNPIRSNVSPLKLHEKDMNNVITYIKPSIPSPIPQSSVKKQKPISIFEKLSKFTQRDYQNRKEQQEMNNSSQNIKRNLNQFKHLLDVTSQQDTIQEKYSNLKNKYESKVQECERLEDLLRNKDIKILQQESELLKIIQLQQQMSNLWKAVDELENQKVRNLTYISELEQVNFGNEKIIREMSSQISSLNYQLNIKKQNNFISEEMILKQFYQKLLRQKEDQIEKANSLAKHYFQLLEYKQIREALEGNEQPLNKNNKSSKNSSIHTISTIKTEDRNHISVFEYSLTPDYS